MAPTTRSSLLPASFARTRTTRSATNFFSAPFIGTEDLGPGRLGPIGGIALATDLNVTYTVDGVPGIFDATVMVVPEPSTFVLAVMDLVAFARCRPVAGR